MALLKRTSIGSVSWHQVTKRLALCSCLSGASLVMMAPCYPSDSPNVIACLPKVGGVTTVYYSAGGISTPPSVAVAAFNAWSALSSSTGVNFVQATSGHPADIYVNTGGRSGDCIFSQPNVGVITIGGQFTPDLTTYSSDGTLAFEHEIGHMLGLKDNSVLGGNVMNQTPAMSPCTPAGSGFSNGGEVPPTSADATEAGTCLSRDTKCQVYR